MKNVNASSGDRRRVSLNALRLLAVAVLAGLSSTSSPVLRAQPVLPAPATMLEGEDVTFWYALRVGGGMGSMLVGPDLLRDGEQGRGRLFLPFSANHLVMRAPDGTVRSWQYRDFAWQETKAPGRLRFEVSDAADGAARLELRQGGEELRAWLAFSETGDALAPEAIHYTRIGDEVSLPFYHGVEADGSFARRSIYGLPGRKPRVYQMLPRLFGNTNETRKINGSIEENGVGKFSDMSEDVLIELADYGYTHIWVTGVLQQATSTDYSEIGEPADDPDILKGLAGSPYAIKDYFDVCPDYADDPARRREEFRELLDRAEEAGLKIVIDLVANHVARSYNSTVRPDLSFGNNDRTNVFFHPENNFFYLTPEVVRDGTRAPLVLPTVDPVTREVTSETAALVGGADGLFTPETRIGRVTGNNVVTWHPAEGDWYETVKLNFGFNFLDPEAAPAHPSAITPTVAIPDTWRKMDEIIAYWQEMGVDGFRADMAHMIPPEFWKWAIHRAKERDPEVLFFAEAYDNDPARIRSRGAAFRAEDGAMVALIDAGFHAVYDDPSYDSLEYLYEGHATANRIDAERVRLGPLFFDTAIRYMENHDEPRIAHPETFGGLGMEVGKPLNALVLGLSRGPAMLYHGQEVGEPALGREGFGGDDTRTTIFDYWSMPEFNKWWNDGKRDGGRLSDEQRELRAWYSRLLHVLAEPAFSKGNFIALNPKNRNNPFYGRVTDLGKSGAWLYSFIRYEPESGDTVLAVINLHPTEKLYHQRLRLTRDAWARLGLASGGGSLALTDLLAEGAEPVTMNFAETRREGFYFETLPPLSAAYYRITRNEASTAEIFPAVDAPTLGLAPVLQLAGGQTRVVDLLRFGQPGRNHRWEIGEVDGLAVLHDDANHSIEVTPEAGFSGLAVLPVSLVRGNGGEGSLEGHLLFAVEPRPVVEFAFRGDAHRNVRLVGDFNGWNQDNDPFVEIEPGHYVLTRTIPAGRYRYKFVVNGNFIEDPEAESREADGYGGYNSILNVRPVADGHAPTLSLVEKSNGALVFRADTSLEGGVAVADAAGEHGGAVRLPVEIRRDHLRVDTSSLPDGARVRVVVADAHGRISVEAVGFASALPDELWERTLMYYAFTDRFNDGDPSNNDPIVDPDLADIANYHGGDFEGIRQKILNGYFRDLGVTVLWLAPVYQNPDGAWQEYLPPYRKYSGYHGYWPMDSEGVERRFGGAEALHALIETAHENGIRVLADLVLKHVHIENPVAGDHPSLFGRLEMADGTRNLRRWNDEPFSTWFEPFLPGFDFHNPAAQSFLIENTLYWLKNFGFDGFRLDAVKHIRPDFWWRYRAIIDDAFPGNHFYHVGETFHDREGIMDFVGPGMLDGQFDFPLYDAIMDVFARSSSGFGDLEHALAASERIYGKTTKMSPLLGNHDKARFMAYADGDLPDPEEPDAEEVAWVRPPTVDNPENYRKLMQAATFLFAVDGVPMLYYGDEIGKSGAGDPDNRRMMRFGDDVQAAEAAVLAHFQRLGQARPQHPSLYLGSRAALLVEAERYAFSRRYLDDISVAAFSRANRVSEFALELPREFEGLTLRDVVSGMRVTVRNGHIRFPLAPMTSALFVPERDE